ncbi:hypothetical protein [Laribacter hongkongensis]|uniref:hypothetical protein n=1 Tax=Laribacter hongkongensis TaxID=168471 RepID=UPI001EFDB641|nr:hypothetical protein [Laribacter hongkongensis]MCG9094435.1 hypothetical protein [Laribacter hongkongensis]
MNALKRAAELLRQDASAIWQLTKLSGTDDRINEMVLVAAQLERMAQADTIAVAGRGAVKLLREMEWENNRFADACPVCASGREQGHAVDCNPADVLAGPEVTPGLYATPQHSSQPGWKLVPEEPTFSMLIAGDGARLTVDEQSSASAVYRAMLAAAPAPDAPSLYSDCARADVSCPIYPQDTQHCVEYRKKQEGGAE